MALPIETRVFGPLTVPKPPAVRAQTRPVANGDGETLQRAAQAFVQTLPADVRERPSQINRDPSKKQDFSDAQRTQEERPSPTAVEEEAARTAPPPRAQGSAFSGGAGFTRFAPVANLVQAQLLEQQSQSDSPPPLTNAQYETSHKAYLSAGAQPGGQGAALKAALLREEQSQRAVVIPPVQTNLNFIA